MIDSNLVNDLKPRPFGLWGRIWTVVLVIMTLIGIWAYYRQIQDGLVITGMRDYAFWGIYISNFVFFVAISLVGSLVTAILRLSGAEWSIPLTRISEIIAVAAIIMAGLTIIVDMGRPDRLMNLFIHGRLQSPIIWDVIVITTYLFISLMLLYFPLIPDFAILKNEKGNPGWIQKGYKRLAINWNGSKLQEKLHQRGIFILSVLIIPVAFGIHTVTSWLFATTFRPGWDSTNFGAYFVSGAFVVGAGGVIAAMYLLRRHYQLEKYITDEHFNKMGKLLVMLCLVYLYFNLNEYLIPAFKLKKEEEIHIYSMLFGHYAPLFWSVIGFGLVMPVILLLFRKWRRPFPLFVISVIVVITSWWKRYLIVTPTLLHPSMPIQGVPESWAGYSPTWMEWAITLGTLTMALLIITILVRFLPIIPIQEFSDHMKKTSSHES